MQLRNQKLICRTMNVITNSVYSPREAAGTTIGKPRSSSALSTLLKFGL